MIVRFAKIVDGSIVTHRGNYLLSRLSVTYIDRPLIGPGVVGAIAATGFGVGFYDLLFAGELIVLALFAAASLVIGLNLTRLSFLSRDLNGSPMSQALWGSFHHINALRREIGAALPKTQIVSGNADFKGEEQ